MKYVVVTGGVVSGLGKGITISSIGRILKACGTRVTAIKIDPYLNVDAGTMSPFEHGETFVLNDGGETDLDLGNYERFLDIQLSGLHNITSGKIYSKVISQERRGDYLGKTVQMVPHATDVVQKWLKEVAQISVDGSGLTPDVCLIEVGGTVGDIESMVFLEALRQFQFSVGRDNIMFLHVSLVPVLGTVGEQKTKPTQHSVKELRAVGLSPDVIICRSTDMLSSDTQRKISSFCHVPVNHVIAVHDVSNLYHVPLVLVKQDIHSIIRKQLHLDHMSIAPELTQWTAMANKVDSLTEHVVIAVVGKYVGLSDSYLSVIKALKHSGILLGVDVDIQWVEAADLEESSETSVDSKEKREAAWAIIKTANGVLVPGGFGGRGVEGKILAAGYAREHKVPFLGVCLGLQVMVIEYARSVLQKREANSSEFDPHGKHHVVVYMPEISPTGDMGGTMRLGARTTVLTKHTAIVSSHSATANGSKLMKPLDFTHSDSSTGMELVDADDANATSSSTLSLAGEIYGFRSDEDASMSEWRVEERHRHRYEVNPLEVSVLETAGMHFTGRDVEGTRMEIAELSRNVHPFYLGTQFHPEFKSRPTRPSPPFFAFVAVSADKANQIGRAGQLWRQHEESINQKGVSMQSSISVAIDSPILLSEASYISSPMVSNKRTLLETGFEDNATPLKRIASPKVCVTPGSTRPAELIVPKPLSYE